jgi:hypothetical protein
MKTTRIYETVIFLDGDGYDEWEALMYPDRTPGVLPFPSGHEDALAHLMQWEYGEATGYAYDTPPWGGGDDTYKVDGYVMSWRPNLSYASLTRITEVHDTACEG